MKYFYRNKKRKSERVNFNPVKYKMVQLLKNQKDVDDFLQNNKLAVIDFFASWYVLFSYFISYFFLTI